MSGKIIRTNYFLQQDCTSKWNCCSFVFLVEEFNSKMGWSIPGLGTGYDIYCVWGGGRGWSELSVPSSCCDEGRGPSHSSLCLAFLPQEWQLRLWLCCPALGRQWRETNLTHSRQLWGPSRSPTAQANLDESMVAVEATYLPIILQCYLPTSFLSLIARLPETLVITWSFFSGIALVLHLKLLIVSTSCYTTLHNNT